MNRPRIAAVLSAIGASTAAFLVVSRWRLVGTLAGAAVVPLVYTVVSHYAQKSLDRAGKWTHRRLKPPLDHPDAEQTGQDAAAVGDEPLMSSAQAVPVQPGVDSRRAETRPSGRMVTKIQWSLAALALMALGISLYAIFQPASPEETVIRERVIEKTVTVTVHDSAGPVAQAPGTSATTVTTSPVNKGGDASSTTTNTVTTLETSGDQPHTPPATADPGAVQSPPSKPGDTGPTSAPPSVPSP